jgi:hypothetical protein
VGRTVRRRGLEVALVALAAVAQVACLGGGGPIRLVDGSLARASSIALDGVGSRQIATRATAVDHPDTTTGPVARCIATMREHAPRAPVIWRVGVDGASVTLATASGREIAACDGTALSTGHDPTWCGVALGRLREGRLRDPRLDLAACSTPSADPIAFAWVSPGPRARYVAVGGDGFVEVYLVVAGLPVRVASTSGIDVDTSSASFEISEHDARGGLLRSYTLLASVAG